MDKNTVLGLVVIAAMLFGFSWYNSSQNKKYAEQKQVEDSIARVRAQEQGQPIDVVQGGPVSPANQVVADDSMRVQQYGQALVSARNQQEQTYTVENDMMIVTFSNKGGKVVGVELKDYRKYSGDNVQMYAPKSARFDMEFFIRPSVLSNDVRVNTDDYYFTTDMAESVVLSESETQQQVSMKLYMDSTSYMEYLYTIHKDDYMMDFDVRFVNMDNIMSNQSDVVFSWSSIGPQNEKGFQNENNYTTISYKYPSKNSVENIGMSEGIKEETENSAVQWVAFKQQFFSSIFIAD